MPSKIDSAPYRFALRAALFVVVWTAGLFGVDRILTSLALHGVSIVPKVPAAEMTRLLASRDRLLLIGDSVMEWVSPTGDRGTLTERIVRQSPIPVVSIARPGRGVDMAAAQISSLLRYGVRPRVVVLELNLRQFSPVWTVNPNLREPDVLLMLRTGVYLPIRAATVFKYDFSESTPAQFGATPVWVDGKVAGTVAEMDRPYPLFKSDDGAPAGIDHSRCLVRYAFDLERSPSLPRLTEIVSSLGNARIPLVLFITPIDMEYLRARLAPAELAAVERNIARLRAEIDRPGIVWEDLSAALPSSAFEHPADAPDEHVGTRGREFLTARILDLAQRATAAH